MKKDKTPTGQDQEHEPRERIQVLVPTATKTLLRRLTAKHYCTQQEMLQILIADAAKAAGLTN